MKAWHPPGRETEIRTRRASEHRDRERQGAWSVKECEDLVNRTTIGENAIRNLTSLSRQTPIHSRPCESPLPSALTPFQPYKLHVATAFVRVPSMNFEFVANHFFAQLYSQHFDMTYKPSGPNDSTLPPLVERGEEEEEEMGGRKWVVYGCLG